MNKVEAVAVLLVNPLNKVLLQLRDNTPEIYQPNVWGLIGGEVEKGETPELAAYRELHEELKYTPGSIEFFHFYALKYRKLHVFVANVSVTDPSSFPLCEGQRLDFFDQEQIFVLHKNRKAARDLIKIVRDFYKNLNKKSGKTKNNFKSLLKNQGLPCL